VPIVGGYRIDQTEVTIGQYGQWVKTNPGLPGGSDTSCNWKTSYNEGGGFTGGDASHHPVGLVDWCDAYYYCAAIGKRLCGKIGGGSYDYNEESFKNNNISQWYRACSSGGTNTYPYGSDGSMLGLNCNVKVPGSRSESVVTGTLENCQTTTANYAGVFDLVGNVYEWEDSCKVNPADSANVQCRARGGSFDSNTILDTCDASGFGIRNQKKESLGFRCCSL
jgi:formylglycine-generating enzyme required for sulfatase activity